jgi:hypothetical protein
MDFAYLTFFESLLSFNARSISRRMRWQNSSAAPSDATQQAKAALQCYMN